VDTVSHMAAPIIAVAAAWIAIALGKCNRGLPAPDDTVVASMNDRAKTAIPKVGQCPSGWMQSGGACQDMSGR
jgi:hypothetical protein